MSLSTLLYFANQKLLFFDCFIAVKMSISSVHSTDEIDESKRSGCIKRFLKERLLPILFKQFMTIGILIALFVGFVFPKLGFWVGSFEGSTYICIIVIFLHSGLKLKTTMKDTKVHLGFD